MFLMVGEIAMLLPDNIRTSWFMDGRPNTMLVVPYVGHVPIIGRGDYAMAQMYVAGFLNVLNAKVEPLPTFEELERRALQNPALRFFLEDNKALEFHVWLTSRKAD